MFADATPLSPSSMAHFLASIHTTPIHLQYGWRLRPSDLKLLAGRVGSPQPDQGRIQQQPLTAVHLATAAAARWLTTTGTRLTLTTQALAWLEQSRWQQIDALHHALTAEPAWSTAVDRFRLASVLSLDLVAYVQQQLTRYRTEARPPRHPQQLRLEASASAWLIHGYPSLPPATIFALHQFAAWQDSATWRVTPFSIARAARHGWTADRLRLWLEDERCALTTPGVEQLNDWFVRLRAVRIEKTHLLTVVEPARLDAMLARRSLRQHVHTRIGPQHAVVSPALQKRLRRYLEADGIPLDAPQPYDPSAAPSADPTALLALHLLAGLDRFMPLTVPGLAHALAEHAAALPAEVQADAERRAAAILSDLEQVIAGRDAFRPQRQPAAAAIRHQIEQALANGTALTIDYQGPGDAEPRRRTVEPRWLESRGALTYLHAFCHLAQRERTFRLDRIHALDR